MKHIISVDAGTTASKISIFNENGQLLAKSTHEYSLITPSPLEVEISADTLWRAFAAGVSDVLQKTGIGIQDVVAIGISAQGETLIPVGSDGKPLRNAIVWLDNRAQEEAKTLNKRFNDGTSYKITGQVKIVPTWPASKILWIKRNEADLFKKVHKYLLVEDYLIYRMTGKVVAEGSLLCSTVYWDITKKKWWHEMLQYLDISEDQLPEIRESGEVIGELLPEAAQELGLSRNTTVCTGALDQAAGAVGVGNIKPGIFSENTGAALAICATLEKPVFDPKLRMPIHYHALPDRYMAHTFTTGGMVLRWFRDNFSQQEMNVAQAMGKDPYDLIGTEATRVPPGCEGLVMLPHLQGAMAPEADPNAKGVFFGFTLHHTRAHFARAIMEAIACIIRRNIEVLEDLKIQVKEIRSLGGGARSSVWGQIKADVTNRPVLVATIEDAACLGAALLAGTALGMFKSLQDACQKTVTIGGRFQPIPANAKAYDSTFRAYVELYNSLKALFENTGS
jgi:xylulokinase